VSLELLELLELELGLLRLLWVVPTVELLSLDSLRLLTL